MLHGSTDFLIHMTCWCMSNTKLHVHPASLGATARRDERIEELTELVAALQLQLADHPNVQLEREVAHWQDQTSQVRDHTNE